MSQADDLATDTSEPKEIESPANLSLPTASTDVHISCLEQGVDRGQEQESHDQVVQDTEAASDDNDLDATSVDSPVAVEAAGPAGPPLRWTLEEAICTPGMLDWSTKEAIAHEIAEGLAELHHQSQGNTTATTFGHLRSSRVWLNSQLHVDQSTFDTLALVYMTREPIDRRWMAPELVMHFGNSSVQHTTMSDMYALGMAMWEMAAQCSLPFRYMEDNNVVATMVHLGGREEIPADTPEEYRRLIQWCWQQDPKDRPTALDLAHYEQEDTVKTATASDEEESNILSASTASISNTEECEELATLEGMEKDVVWTIAEPLRQGRAGL